MTQQESLRFRVSWIALLVTGLATLVFGLVVMVVRSSDEQYLRAIGAASVGMGLFGAMITVTAFRRRERWAFFSLGTTQSSGRPTWSTTCLRVGTMSTRSSSSCSRSSGCCSRSASSFHEALVAVKSPAAVFQVLGLEITLS